MKLVDNSSQWYRFWSIRFSLLSAFLGALELLLPMWSNIVPPKLFAALATIVGIAAAVSRVIDQQLPTPEAKE